MVKPPDLELQEWQRLLRKEFGSNQPFIFKNLGDQPFFSDFSVTNPETQKTYRVSIRGGEQGMNYCSCPDYRISGSGAPTAGRPDPFPERDSEPHF